MKTPMKTPSGPATARQASKLAATTLVLLLHSLLTIPGLAAVPQKLGAHVPAAVARVLPGGRLPATQRLQLAISLPLRNQAALKQLTHDLYDPKSPSYHRYLTPEQFARNFGPTGEDYQKVMDFAGAHSLRVTATYTNRVVVDVEGTVADVEKALHTTLRTYPHPTEARQFYAPDVDPSLDLDVPILRIDGLSDYDLPHPASGAGCCGSGPLSGSSFLPTYGGTDFRDAYCRAPFVGNATPLTGAGQSVGLFQFADYNDSDIAAYEKQFGLPSVNVVRTPINGGHTNDDGDGNLECSLDIEMVIAMAPGVSAIYVYEGTHAVDILSAMVSNPAVKQFGSSWSWGGDGTAEEQLFIQMQAQGQSFFNATGDTDAYTGDIPYPSDSPSITEVGGTVLDMTLSGTFWASEVVWNPGNYDTNKMGYVGSSGGSSTRFGIPSYQVASITPAFNKGSLTMRNIPDVAMVAQDVWIAYGNGKTTSEGGTSVAAPLWAGYMALVNELGASIGRSSAGFINPAIYAIGQGAGQDTYANCFNDITSGDNKSPNSPNLFPAVKGYDLCTGWGTPSYPLLNALSGAENVYWVDLTVTDAQDPFPNGDKASPFWYLIDNYVVDKPGALGRVPDGAQLVFESTGSGSDTTESDSVVSGTGVTRISKRVRISAVPGLTVKIKP